MLHFGVQIGRGRGGGGGGGGGGIYELFAIQMLVLLLPLPLLPCIILANIGIPFKLYFAIYVPLCVRVGIHVRYVCRVS